MSGKRTLIQILAMIFMVAFSTVAVENVAQAKNLSAGCNTVNGGAFANNRLFLTGETVSLTITIPSGDAQGDIFFDGNLVATTGLFLGPGTRTASYTFPADAVGDLAWTVLDTAPPGTLVTNTSCELPGASGDVGVLAVRPDDRINWRAGDDIAVLYTRPDEFGNPALDVYCLYNGEGIWKFRLTEADVEAWDDSLPQDVPLATVPECNASLYELDTGQIQINITLDADKYYEIICEDLSCSSREIRFSDPSLWPRVPSRS
ncbi:MAG: hypothetical protein KC496_14845 [Anaerolineae bacterium]|nr:hypothetical protein [Anaerolineae bacterium]